jgi:hypothetical protein
VMIGTPGNPLEPVVRHAELARLGDLPDRIQALPTELSQAVSGVLGLSATASPVRELTLNVGVLALVLELAATTPVLLSVDDIQWVDPETVAVLS